jgi:hypothetical protein
MVLEYGAAIDGKLRNWLAVGTADLPIACRKNIEILPMLLEKVLEAGYIRT